jgi:hypothetical protein
MFSTSSVPGCYKQDKLGVGALTYLLAVGYSLAGKKLSMEAQGIVVFRHQATTCEDKAHWEYLVRSAVKCRVCELAIALQLRVVMICK